MSNEVHMESAPGVLQAVTREYSIDPHTGIRPISEWGAHCGRGFVSNGRFASSATEQVIKRTDRSAQRRRK